MSLARIKSWVAEVLTASDLNAEFNNLLNFINATPYDLPQGQIKFPATRNASSNVNTLDDYEEGVFTPTDNLGSGSTGNGVYTKVGDTVIGQGYIIWAAGISGSATQLKLQGFPFTFALPSTIGGSVSITYWSSFGTPIQAAADSATTVSLYDSATGTTIKGNTGLAGLTMQFTFSYKTTL